MVDRPILFSAPMVRALLDGRKTQTRRVLKPQPPEHARYSGIHFASDEPATWFFNSPTGPFKARVKYVEDDQLWVRESFRQGYAETFYSKGLVYRADALNALGMDEYSSRHNWKPSIHMPRWASRLTLTVTDVRVQRVQEIGHDDAVAEGMGIFPPSMSAQKRFREIWDSLNAKRGYGWDANPWVVALTFAVERRNIDT